jgi:hypothetical protein
MFDRIDNLPVDLPDGKRRGLGHRNRRLKAEG